MIPPLLRARASALLAWIPAALLAVAAPAAGGELGADLRSDLLDDSRDRTLRGAFVPSERNVHGEVRLIRRGDAWVLQTLIDSPQLRRGIQRMRKKELYAWPAGEPGHDASEDYLEDLETARDRVLEAFEERADRGDRAQRMLIELVLAPRAALWAFLEVDAERTAGGWEVRERRPIVAREADRAYLRRAFSLQAAEAFDGEPPELAELPP